MIFVNHIPDNPLSFFTLRNWGFSDAAEIFVFLAGFSAALSFEKYFRKGGFLCGVLRVARRTWQLFCAHVLLIFALSLVIAVAGIFTDSKPIMEQLNFSPFFVETDVAILRLVRLQYMPSMTDILPIYIVFVAMFPAIWLLMRFSPYAALAASFAMWLWTNATGYSFPNYPEGSTWFFNPLAWQFMFVAGVFVANHGNRGADILRSRFLVFLSAGVVLAGILAAAPWVHYVPWSGVRLIPAEYLSLDNKGNLSAVRILHFAALLFLAARLLPRAGGVWKTPGARLMIAVGQQPLPVYCMGVVLAQSAHIFLRMRGAGMAETILVVAAGMAALVALALALKKSLVILRRADLQPTGVSP